MNISIFRVSVYVLYNAIFLAFIDPFGYDSIIVRE